MIGQMRLRAVQPPDRISGKAHDDAEPMLGSWSSIAILARSFILLIDGSRWLSGLLPLDDVEHSDPELRARTIATKRRNSGVAPCYDACLGAMYRDHVAGERDLGGPAGFGRRRIDSRAGLFPRHSQRGARSAMNTTGPEPRRIGTIIGGTTQALIIVVLVSASN
jgi:hypothetical protein